MRIGYATLIVYAPQALALTLALTLLIPQWREVYISIAERSDLVQTVLGTLGLSWLSAVIYSWNWAKTDQKVDDVYPEHARISIDQDLKEWRDVKPLGSAVLIPAAVALGMFWAANWCGDVLTSLESSPDQELIATLTLTRYKLWLFTPIVPAAIFVCLSMLAGTRLLHDGINASRWPATVAVIVAPLVLDMDQLVSASRVLGPIATFGLFGIALVTVIRAIVEILPAVAFSTIVALQTVPASAMTLIVHKAPRMDRVYLKKTLTGLMVALLPVLTLLAILFAWDALTNQSRLTQADTTAPAHPQPGDGSDLHNWLLARGAIPATGATPPRVRYPVFVVAAQGGGIYAASSSMSLLTTLQASCPAFSDHLFAISAVSGGAIGSAAFTGLTVDRKTTDTSCEVKSATTTDDFRQPVEHIVTGDHLSPVLASTLTDWVAKVLLLNPLADSGGEPQAPRADAGALSRAMDIAAVDLPAKRSEALTSSFVSSYRTAVAAPSQITLSQPFETFWNSHPRAPFLLLNATSAETGQRVTFSPIALQGIGDGTLNAARDIVENWKLSRRSQLALTGETLIGAAITSARFPGILPGWAVHHDRIADAEGRKARRRMNLVDGGYFDPSGAATAFDLLEHLDKLIAANGLKQFVSLHLILLTDSGTLTDLASANGSRAVDIGVPVQALLNSRSMLARRATLRAINELPAKGIDVIQIVLNEDIVPLPLGWMLSRTSHRIIAAMMGRPETCGTSAKDDLDNTELRTFSPSQFQSIVRKNSCAQMRILTLLNRS